MDISKPTGSKAVAALSRDASSYTLCLQSLNKKPTLSRLDTGVDKRKEQQDKNRAALIYLLTHNLFLYLHITGQAPLLQTLYFGKKVNHKAKFILARLRRTHRKKTHILDFAAHTTPITFFDCGFTELHPDLKKLAVQESRRVC